jgi:hypothetical protein
MNASETENILKSFAESQLASEVGPSAWFSALPETSSFVLCKPLASVT